MKFKMGKWQKENGEIRLCELYNELRKQDNADSVRMAELLIFLKCSKTSKRRNDFGLLEKSDRASLLKILSFENKT